MPKIIAFTNQKGGVGKTTTAINLGASLAVLGEKVLLIDLDPQANATSGLGLDKKNIAKSIYDVLLGTEKISSVISSTGVNGLDLVPSSLALAGAEIELVNLPNREKRLKYALASSAVLQNYQWVFIDCPPSLGLLTINALVATQSVLLPLQCEYYALEGLESLLQTIARIMHSLNPTLRIEGILLTMFDARTNLSQQVADNVQKNYGQLVAQIIRRVFVGKVFNTVIPRNVRLAEAPSFGKPIILYDKNCPGTVAYMNLARELKHKK